MDTTIINYHRAGFPVLWIETAEPDRTTTTVCKALKEEGVTCATWDILQGIASPDGAKIANETDPGGALVWLGKAPGPTVLIASLLHRFANSVEIQQAILTGAAVWKAEQRQLVILAPPGARPPVEIERAVHVLDEPLPTVTELRGIVSSLAKQNEFEVDEAATAEALRGLTVAEAENLVALAAVRGDAKVNVSEVQHDAARTILAASGDTLELARPEGGFDTLAGLDQLKGFCGRAIRSPQARGVILLGIAGGGKTAFALALGAETQLPVYLWDLGKLFGGIVGESEANARRAIRAIEAAGRSIVLIDEIEKGTSGMSGSGAGDSGTTARTMGTVLKWLSDRKPGNTYVVATCNDVLKLPPEMTRAERWDATFFVDLPTEEERAGIYAIHAKGYGIKEPFPIALTDGWTGAEIRSLCRIADMLEAPLAEASRYVVPLSRSRSTEVQGLRDWAAGRCVPANVQATTQVAKPRTMRINRGN